MAEPFLLLDGWKFEAQQPLPILYRRKSGRQQATVSTSLSGLPLRLSNKVLGEVSAYELNGSFGEVISIH